MGVTGSRPVVRSGQPRVPERAVDLRKGVVDVGEQRAAVGVGHGAVFDLAAGLEGEPCAVGPVEFGHPRLAGIMRGPAQCPEGGEGADDGRLVSGGRVQGNRLDLEAETRGTGRDADPERPRDVVAHRGTRERHAPSGSGAATTSANSSPSSVSHDSVRNPARANMLSRAGRSYLQLISVRTDSPPANR